MNLIISLITGLKDLADFLPASLATIVSYFSAEVSRGVWKHVLMNGVDWPSPAANLSNVEEQIKKILAATGVDIPSLFAGASFSHDKLTNIYDTLHTTKTCIHQHYVTADYVY